MARPRCANPPATASLFIQLSMRRPAAAGGFPILDLLLPSAPPRAGRAPSLRAHHRALSTATSPVMSRTGDNNNTGRWRGATTTTSSITSSSSSRSSSRLLSPATSHQQRRRPATAWSNAHRAFSTTTAQRATHAIHNRQFDDDGNEMTLEITPRAAKRLTEIMTKDNNPYLALRIQVESGGCHGFQYLMKLVTLPPTLPPAQEEAAAGQEGEEPAIREDDTIFTYSPDDGAPAQPDLTAPKIILDFPSLELLKGSKVDFTMELIGSQFKIVDNPYATSSCGCGTSFDIKI